MTGAAYGSRVTGFLRFAGVINAAVWLGAAVLFTFGTGPAVFSEDMRTLLGPANFPYFSGAVAQVLIVRFFRLQLICAVIALTQLFATWLYLGRPPGRFTGGLLAVVLALGLVMDFGFQPHIKKLHLTQHAPNLPVERREAAARSLRLWHRLAQGTHCCLLIGLTVYLWRVAHPADPSRSLQPRLRLS